MTKPVTDMTSVDAAHGTARPADGVPVTVIHDSPGFVAQRVVATIVNIGCDIAQQRIASPEDIDRAVTLGLGYPHGPLALGDALGARASSPCWRRCTPLRRPALPPQPLAPPPRALGVSLLTPGT